MRLNIRALSLSSAIAGVLLYTFGAVVDATSAWGGATVVSYIFRVDVVDHALPLTVGSYLLGATIFAALFGAVAACVSWTYNVLTHAPRERAPSTAATR